MAFLAPLIAFLGSSGGAALSAGLGLAGAGVGIGEAVSNSDAEKAAIANASKTATTTTTPTPISAPTAPQISSAANTQFLTGGGVGAAPDYLQQLLQSTSGQPQNPAVDLTALQGYLS
jgi:hypothetical protein